MTDMQQSKTAVPIAFGCMTIGEDGKEMVRISKSGELQSILDVLKKHGVNELDSARIYGEGTSETKLGDIAAESQGFKIATKVFPNKRYPVNAHWKQYDHGAADVRRSIGESLIALKTNSVDLLYLHAPDRETPFEETLKAIDEEYKMGKFKRFGISNYTVNEVESIMKIVKEKNYIAPTVYQGLYNAIARAGEAELIPTLRKYKISYYTYNPLGGGFFTGAYDASMKQEEGSATIEKGSKFDANTRQGAMYRKRYFHDCFFQAIEVIRPVAQKNSLTLTEIALRWNMHHSQLKEEYHDHVIVSASSIKHIEENLIDFEKGPLPEEVVAALDQAWDMVRKSENFPKYHF